MDKLRFLVDVTIVQPCNKTNCSKAQHALGAAQQAELIKIRKYGQACRDAGAIFVPFAIETHGGVGPLARAFVTQLNTRSSTPRP